MVEAGFAYHLTRLAQHRIRLSNTTECVRGGTVNSSKARVMVDPLHCCTWCICTDAQTTTHHPFDNVSIVHRQSGMGKGFLNRFLKMKRGFLFVRPWRCTHFLAAQRYEKRWKSDRYCTNTRRHGSETFSAVAVCRPPESGLAPRGHAFGCVFGGANGRNRTPGGVADGWWRVGFAGGKLGR